MDSAFMRRYENTPSHHAQLFMSPCIKGTFCFVPYGVTAEIALDYVSFDGVNVVPEPSSLALLALDAGSVLAFRRRRQAA
jgi:hypothetical protein